MEISVGTYGLRQSAAATGTGAQKTTDRRGTAAAKTDLTEWSRQAVEFIQRSQAEALEEARKKQEQRRELDSLTAEAEQNKKRLDALSKGLRIQRLCMKIAASIKRGDKVPQEDLEFLIKHDPEGYKLAMAFRKPKKDPEECKSVLKEEDKRSESASGVSASGDGSGESASGPESAAPAEGGASAAGVSDGAV